MLKNKYTIHSSNLSRGIKVPSRLGGGLKQIGNTSIKDNYTINIYYAVLYVIINDWSGRFQENSLNILNCIQDILLNNITKQALFDEVSQVYGLVRVNLKSETVIFNRMHSNCAESEISFESSINLLLLGNNEVGFSTLASVLKLFLIIPINSLSRERSFSCLKPLKSYLRTIMGQDRLSNLAILQGEQERIHSIEKDEKYLVSTLFQYFDYFFYK